MQYAPFIIAASTGVLPNEFNFVGKDLIKMAKKTQPSKEEMEIQMKAAMAKAKSLMKK